MGRWWRTSACDRARQWISLELDSELTQLEEAALARHLSLCARCRAVSAEFGAFTQLLREAPLLDLDRPVVVAAPRLARSRAARRAAVSLAFAALAAAAVLGSLVFGGRSSSPGSELSFRNAKEQRLFAQVQARRIEPAAFVTVVPTVPSLASRALI
jgi:predicted anti-sigma-YlaC factor YlaD